MEHNYTGRIVFILAVVFVALWAIFPDGDITQPRLRPGIDMAGGTSLLYQIKEPEGGVQPGENLAVKVMEALRKRVDPQGVRNLSWRPIGNTQLEIQMPNSGKSAQGLAAQSAYLAAQRELSATNLSAFPAIHAVETLKGDERQKQLEQLSAGSADRAKVLDEMAAAFDRIGAAHQAQDAKAQAAAEIAYEGYKGQLDQFNLYPAELQQILDAGPETRAKKLAELNEKFAGWPARLAAIEHFASTYDTYQKYKDTIDSAAELKRLLRGSGVLEFHILVSTADLQSAQGQQMIQRLKSRGPAAVSGDQMRWYLVDRPEEFRGQQTYDYNDKEYVLAWDTPNRSMTHGPGQAHWGLQSAYATNISKGFSQQRAVGFQFDAVGANIFGKLTTDNTHEPLAIVLDNKVISAPNINEPITGGTGTISGGGAGGFTEAELNYLVSTLSAGSLPAQLADQPIREQTIGPTLGQDNLKRGLMACVAGLIVVGLFMILYYHLSGVVATFALVLNIVITIGIMAMLDATFTLPAIAGLVLTMGIAVDANVLIFERLREESARGLTLRMALVNAYDRAWSAIVDSNITTLITCAVLYWFGTEDVKGFGLTLGLGLLSSLFTALFVTRTIFGLGVEKFGLQKLGSLPQSWPALGRALHPRIDWMSKIWYFITLSVVVMVIGLVALVVKAKQGEMLDVEFSAGTSVQFDLVSPMDRAAVQELMDAEPEKLPAAMVVAVGVDGLEYSVVTPNANANEVRDTILSVMGDRLKLERGSSFVGAGQTVEQALGHEILPIKDGKVTVQGFSPRSAMAHDGGVAFVLRNLDPKLSPDVIRTRIQRQMLQALPDGTQLPYRDIDVESPSGETEPTSLAVVLVSDSTLRYGDDSARWQDNLAAPIWGVIDAAINNPPTIQRVTTFNPSVAGDMRSSAFMSLGFAIAAIMIYVWIRFGNVRFGAATVIAMLHDAILVLAFLGLSHYVANTFIGRWLMIEPFRVNMTLVAAILTVMGYSMVDTIVVFDRIRENRGRLGILSRNIINDSINQTISRTLLTAGTTLMTVLVMYIAGGTAIHGFTFVLLIGILIGTYSSIAIASPLLLLSEHKAKVEEDEPAAGRLQRANG